MSAVSALRFLSFFALLSFFFFSFFSDLGVVTSSIAGDFAGDFAAAVACASQSAGVLAFGLPCLSSLPSLISDFFSCDRSHAPLSRVDVPVHDDALDSGDDAVVARCHDCRSHLGDADGDGFSLVVIMTTSSPLPMSSANRRRPGIMSLAP